MQVRRATSDADLATCLTIRRVVFVVGQDVPEAEEVDGRDPDCLHYLLEKDGEAIATARVQPMGSAAKIQRVAVLDAHRSAGVGAYLMRAILEDLVQNHRFAKAVLGSQTHAIGFYEKLRFAAYGPTYDDAGIPHRDMALSL